jgi:hypothetical protein
MEKGSKQSLRKEHQMRNDLENDRVRRNTSPSTLARIDTRTDANIRFFSTQPPAEISARLQELEQEWSIERYLQTNASIVALSGAVLGLALSKKWFLLSAAVTGFLFQHAVQGWCPPLPLFRHLGVRTRGEIDREKFSLKAARGDFEPLERLTASPPTTPDSTIGNTV